MASLLFIYLACLCFNNYATAASVVSDDFSNAEQNCFQQDKVLYKTDGQCYTLLQDKPCGERQWFVLDKNEVINGTGKLQGICSPIPCENPVKVYWTADGKCYRPVPANSNLLCKFEGTVLQSNPFGDGECGCKTDPPHACWEGETNSEYGQCKCYPLHHRGPCPVGQIFVSSSNGHRSVGSCVQDPCKDNNTEHEVSYGLWEGDGQCYQLGTLGPCRLNNGTFNVHQTTKKPECMITSNLLSLFNFPPNCHTDSSGNCKPEIKVPPNDKKYVLSLIAAAKQQRSKRTVKNKNSL